MRFFCVYWMLEKEITFLHMLQNLLDRLTLRTLVASTLVGRGKIAVTTTLARMLYLVKGNTDNLLYLCYFRTRYLLFTFYLSQFEHYWYNYEIFAGILILNIITPQLNRKNKNLIEDEWHSFISFKEYQIINSHLILQKDVNSTCSNIIDR